MDVAKEALIDKKDRILREVSDSILKWYNQVPEGTQILWMEN